MSINNTGLGAGILDRSMIKSIQFKALPPLESFQQQDGARALEIESFVHISFP